MSGECRNRKLAEMLEKEFLVCIDRENEAEIQKAIQALTAYKSVEEFLEETSWGRDNPESQEEQYLTKNRICRWFEGQFWYFSRIQWEEEN